MWHDKKEAGEKTLFQKGVKCAVKRNLAPAASNIIMEGNQQDLQAWANYANLEQVSFTDSLLFLWLLSIHMHVY